MLSLLDRRLNENSRPDDVLALSGDEDYVDVHEVARQLTRSASQPVKTERRVRA